MAHSFVGTMKEDVGRLVGALSITASVFTLVACMTILPHLGKQITDIHTYSKVGVDYFLNSRLILQLSNLQSLSEEFLIIERKARDDLMELRGGRAMPVRTARQSSPECS